MILDTGILKKHNPCIEGMAWYLSNGQPTVENTVEALIAADKLDWANWLIARMLSRKRRIQYSIYAAELCIDRYEIEHPDGKSPREAIEAARAVLADDTPANWDRAASAANAAWSAANAMSTESAANAAWSAESAASAASTRAAASAESATNAAWSAASAASAASTRAAAWSAALLKTIRHGLTLIQSTNPPAR